MSKVMQKANTALFPLPTILVTSVAEGCPPNIMTLAWTGIMNSEPPILYIGVNTIRYSHKLIQESGEFVINIPSADLARQVDYCGQVSGDKVDKFMDTGLTATPAAFVKAPMIAECPVNIECRVRETLCLGSHDAFIADILAVHYNEEVLNEKGRPDISLIKPYGYSLGEYRLLTEKIGSFGFSKKQGPSL